jgi:hypothetical protein
MRFNVYLLVLLGAVALGGCRKEPERVNEVVAISAANLPTDPEDKAWERAPEHVAKLVPQDLVEPRLMNTSTSEVKVRAITNGSEVAFRMEWLDGDKNDAPGPGKFSDACAVQIPAQLDKEAPDPQMGGQGKIVQVTYWRADWEASVNGRRDGIRDLYPNASIDHYPFEAKSLDRGSDAQKAMALRYAPAHTLGNLRAGPRSSAVEDLTANGPGTLTPAISRGSKGKGIHGQEGWSVVISRKLPEGLGPRQRTQVALAVWQGSRQEAGARKMRSGWIPLLVRGS